MSSSDALLQVDGLSTVISTGRGPLRAVDEVSFCLEQGRTLGIVGESGSGKSVLGRTVMGLYTTDRTMQVSGQVRFRGADIQSMSAAQRRQVWGRDIGMVFQDPSTALNPVRRVGDHVVDTLRQHAGMGRRQGRERTVELFALVGIPEPRRRIDQYPHELSGGMRQRVVIAMALANDPALLIADEPTTALDVTVQRQILALLARLREELGMALILISHDLAVVADTADDIAVMYGGGFVETGPSEVVLATPRHQYTAGLLGAAPDLADPPGAPLAVIPGTPPDMVMPPPGCRFAPRCPAAADDCRARVPRLRGAGDAPGHAHACLHPVDARES